MQAARRASSMISSFFALVMMMLDPSPLAMQVGRMLSNLPLRSKTWGVTWREVGLQTEIKQYQRQFHNETQESSTHYCRNEVQTSLMISLLPH